MNNIGIAIVKMNGVNTKCNAIVYSVHIIVCPMGEGQFQQHIDWGLMVWPLTCIVVFYIYFLTTENLSSAKEENLGMQQVLDQTLQELGSLWKYQWETKKEKS